jgi:hypothetical protein
LRGAACTVIAPLLVKDGLPDTHETLHLLVVREVGMVGRGVELNKQPRSLLTVDRVKRFDGPVVLGGTGLEGDVAASRITVNIQR